MGLLDCDSCWATPCICEKEYLGSKIYSYNKSYLKRVFDFVLNKQTKTQVAAAQAEKDEVIRKLRAELAAAKFTIKEVRREEGRQGCECEEVENL